MSETIYIDEAENYENIYFFFLGLKYNEKINSKRLKSKIWKFFVNFVYKNSIMYKI